MNKSALLLLMISFTGCIAPMIRMDTIANIDRGMQVDELVTRMGHKPKEIFNPETVGPYSILVFNMQTGTTKQAVTVFVNGQAQTNWVTVSVYEKYFFLIKEDQLVFWGFVADFKKEPDSEINRLGTLIQTRLE